MGTKTGVGSALSTSPDDSHSVYMQDIVVRAKGTIPGHPECVETISGKHYRVASGAFQTCYLRERDGDQPLPLTGKQDVTEAVLEDFGQWMIYAPDEERRLLQAIEEDLVRRTDLGVSRYGTPLQTFNGRDALLDAYEELLDATKYLKQYILEQNLTRLEAYTYVLRALEQVKKLRLESQ